MYKVRIDKFEGPFDLLIYLLENAKMDIYDIKVAEITEQYIAYLKEMEDLNIEVETEFIVLAAVLIRLKSHMLLPRVSDNPDDDVIVEDPRMELATRILDYMRTKKSAEMLQEREEYNLAIHEKPAEDLSKYVGEPDEILKASDEQRVNAFILFLTRKKKIEEVQRRYQRVRRRKESIETRIKDMTKILELRLTPDKSGISFMELLPEETLVLRRHVLEDKALHILPLGHHLRTKRMMYGGAEVVADAYLLLQGHQLVPMLHGFLLASTNKGVDGSG